MDISRQCKRRILYSEIKIVGKQKLLERQQELEYAYERWEEARYSGLNPSICGEKMQELDERMDLIRRKIEGGENDDK